MCLKLYIQGDVVYEETLDFEGMKLIEQREDYVSRIKHHVLDKYKRSLAVLKPWEIVLEVGSKMNEMDFETILIFE